MPELGTKYECPNCGTKFYDLGRPEPICPQCEVNAAEAQAEEQPRSAAGKPRAATKKSRKAKKSSKKKAAADAGKKGDDKEKEDGGSAEGAADAAGQS